MSDLELKVRLTGEAGQLVGQLKEVAGAETAVAKEATAMADAYKRADAAIDALATAQAEAKQEIQAAAAALKNGSATQAEYNASVLRTKAALSALEIEQRKAVAGYNQHAAAAKGAGASLGAMKASSANLGAQISDVTQQLAIGQNPMMVFGQQAGQVAFALSGMKGVAGTVGTFLAGPWGSLILAGVTVLGLFLTAEEKAKKGALDLADGLDLTKISAGELTKAIDELEAAQAKESRTAAESLTMKRANAEALLNEARAQREKTKAFLEELQARLSAQNIGFGSNVSGVVATAGVLGTATVQRQLDALNGSVTKAEALLRETQIPIANMDSKTRALQQQQATLTATYRAGNMTLAEYTKQMTAAKDAQEAQTKAAREAAKVNKNTNASMMEAFGNPLPGGRLTSGFGPRKSFTTDNGARASSFHAGIDLAAPIGTPVLAAMDGIVKFAGMVNGYGNQLQLDHGAGTQTRYSHLNSFSVRDGQAVTKGQQIGTVGQTGNATGPHLDYQVRVNGKPVDPTKGRFPVDAGTIAEQAQKAGDTLKTFGDSASASISRISERFAEQPKLVGQVNMAVADLDRTIADLRDKQPPGFEKMIADAQAAKQVVENSLTRPFNEYVKASDRAREIQLLTLAGREDEAKALQQINQLVEQTGFATAEQRKAILENVQSERELNDLLAKRQVIVGAYTGAINDARSNLEGLLSGRVKGGDFLKNMQQSYMDTQAKLITEKLFGPMLRDLQKQVEETTGITSSVDIMKAGTEKAGGAAVTLADALENAAKRADVTFNGSPATSPVGGSVGTGGAGYSQFLQEFDSTLGRTSGPAETETADNTNEIVVVGQKLQKGVMAMTPGNFMQQLSRDIMDPSLSALDKIFGTNLQSLSGTLAGALKGYATAGIPGAVLGGLASIKGLPDNISKALGGALKGAQTGTVVSTISNSIGIKMNNTGAQIGGALGSLIGGPIGSIVGSIAGGLLGNLFKSVKSGYAQIRPVENGGSAVTGTYGRTGDLQTEARATGNSFVSAVKQLAESLGGKLGGFDLDLGRKDDKFAVTSSRVPGGTQWFSDQEEALKFAMSDAIKGGAVQGISAAMQRALQANASDVETAAAEALKVRDLESILGGFSGAARTAFSDFEKMAKERLRVATQYGLDVVEVEKTNTADRIKLRDQLEKQSFGSLLDLINSMKSGDLFEGSAVDKRTALLGEIDKARGDAAQGKEGAADTLASLLQQLNATSKDVYGTTGGFSADRDNILSTAQGVADLLRSQLDAAAAPAAQTNTLLDENNDQNAAMLAELQRIYSGMAGSIPGAAGALTPQQLAALASTQGASTWAGAPY